MVKFYRIKYVPSYLDLLEAGGRLTEVLRHVEALGGVDLGVDQPLLELSEGRAEALVQQLLLTLASPGGLEAETGKQSHGIEQWLRPTTGCVGMKFQSSMASYNSHG